MKLIKQDLLTLLISLFLFASCKSTDTVGLDVDPAQAIQGTLVDTATVVTKTMLEDRALTYGLQRHPLGFLTDQTFGTTRSNLAMTVNVPNDGYNFGKNVQIDSAVLVLGFSTNFYGDTTSTTYNINIHQLTERPSLISTFYNDRPWGFQPVTPLGSYNGKIRPATPFKIMDIVKGKPDTLKKVPAQIRIKVSPAFIQQYIDSASLVTNLRFTDKFKGLYATVNTQGPGGMMFFDFNTAGASKLDIYYRNVNATIDTTVASFPIANASGPVIANIIHDYTGTPVKTQLDAPAATPQQAVTYLQPMVGLKNKISFPYITKLRDQGRIVINKAELVIETSAGTDVAPFLPAPRLILYRYDVAGQRSQVPDNNRATATAGGDRRALDEASFGGFYNTDKKSYSFTITSYIQDLVDGKPDYGTFIAPTDTPQSILPTSATAARSVIGSYQSPTGGTNNKVRLKVYYTRVN